MMMSSLLKAALPAATALLLAVVSAGGTAAADPVNSPLVETTCSYAQLDSALKVADPQLADRLAQNVQAQSKVEQFLALSVDARKQQIADVLGRNPQWQQAIDDKRNTREGQQKIAVLNQVASTCHNY